MHTRTREDDLREKFSAFGRIKSVVLKKTYAFIDFEESEAAQAAIKGMDGKAFVNGEELTVEQSGRYEKGQNGNYSAWRKEEEKWTTEGRRLLQLSEEGTLGQRVQKQEEEQVATQAPQEETFIVRI